MMLTESILIVALLFIWMWVMWRTAWNHGYNAAIRDVERRSHDNIRDRASV